MKNEYMFANTCKDCFRKMNPNDYFGVKNELWKMHSDHPKDMICINCFEIRIERKLAIDDFKNDQAAFTNEILKNKTPQEFRYNLYLLWKSQNRI